MAKPFHLAVFLFILAFSSVLGSVATAAELEITPFAGYRFGTAELKGAEVCIGGSCPGAESRDDITYGLALGVSLGEHWTVELRASRQKDDLDFDLSACIACLTVVPEGELEQTTILLGLERRFQLERAVPFVAFGAGTTRLETVDRILLPFPSVDESRFTASLATGLLLPLNDLLSLRLEARGYFTDLPEDIAEDDLIQFGISTGLTFRL